MSTTDAPTFLTVGDAQFFPGVLATCTSIKRFHPDAPVIVIDNCIRRKGFTASQTAALTRLGVEVVAASEFELNDRKLAAWELKAYGAEFYARQTGILVGIDSDCVLCGAVDDIIGRARLNNGFLGGKDVSGPYDSRFSIYGIDTPAGNPAYMSTSLYFCETTEPVRQVLSEWAFCCSRSEFGGTGPYPGHGDQGVLNALLYARRPGLKVELLENDLWSQHWIYWSYPLEIRNGTLYNPKLCMPQRSLHTSGRMKHWRPEYRKKLMETPGFSPGYAWFLWCFKLGCELSGARPGNLVGPASRHLIEDMDAYNDLIKKFNAR